MKIQKYAIFVEKSSKINILQIKNIIKLEITVIIIQVNIEALQIEYVI